MAEIIECPQCKDQLHLPENMIGKRVKCPLCQNIFLARAPGADPDEPTAFNLTPEPERRPGSRQRERERPERERPERERRDRYDQDEEDDYDDRRDRRRERNRGPFDDEDRPRGRPHRGGLILTLAIFGLFCFGVVLGPIAWAMASEDLGSMGHGEMDRTGEGTTRAGMIIGIVATLLHLLVCGGYFFAFLIFTL